MSVMCVVSVILFFRIEPGSDGVRASRHSEIPEPGLGSGYTDTRGYKHHD